MFQTSDHVDDLPLDPIQQVCVLHDLGWWPNWPNFSTWRDPTTKIEKYFLRGHSNRIGGNGFKMKVILGKILARNSLLWEQWGTETGYPEKQWMPQLCVEVFKIWFDGDLSNLVWWKMTLSTTGGSELGNFFSSNPGNSRIIWLYIILHGFIIQHVYQFIKSRE